MSGRPALGRSALIIGLGGAGSRVLGLVREQVVAALFGASAATDAFRVAFRVPLALYDLLIGGMVSSAMVPVLSEDAADNAALGRRLSVLLTVATLILLAAVVLLMALAPQLIALLGAGYSAGVQALSVDLVRVVLPALVFMGVSGVLTAALNSRERFHYPAIATAAFNGGVVLAALALHQQFGIASLALGVVGGAALQAALQAPGLRGVPLRPRFDLTDPALRRMLRLYLPVALGLVVSTVGIAIDTNLASRTGEGSLAAMGFATTLVQFPLGLIATGVSSAVLPALARHAKVMSGDGGGSARQAYRSELALALRLVLVTIAPATVALVVLREPVIALLFQRGAFDDTAAARTSLAFLAYAPGLPAAALDQVLIFGFYAQQRTIPPVLVGVAAVGIYLVCGLALIGPLGMTGLALANSVQWLSHAIIMALLTQRSLGGLGGLGLGPAALRVVLASLAMAAILLVVRTQLLREAPGDGLFLAGGLVVAGVAGAAAYVGTLAVLGRGELTLLVDAVRARRG
ncbi:MAG: murein biosynthesis integral membrane protein MurJ [Dehalococcoidia bacterium]|nr:murein biosynthesis integral membrane protein MurJ [Dehalococcoidia bacterium]